MNNSGKFKREVIFFVNEITLENIFTRSFSLFSRRIFHYRTHTVDRWTYSTHKCGQHPKIDITNVEVRVHEQRRSRVMQDHTKTFSIPFSDIGLSYLHDSALQNKQQSGFDVYLFSSNYSYNPITDDPQDLEKLLEEHNQYASHYLGNRYINLQSFSYGQEHILIQPSKEVQLMQCTALSNYLNNYPSSLATIIQQSEDWPCEDAIQKSLFKNVRCILYQAHWYT